ncbi:Nif3-like dinuclear metal center hexameric protein [endosymbiont of unidentified scaly snail isolate Monju]|uniref:Nif3-like dinuclear metal center hexameric protein n=1 Tax=endosymbiont of unidentified scaly snail isolate Monju TaxID=1248727 RepID=UPI0003892169|nr:Nif3-like dinuclear metal center hexameric protein [endosymbiont of unidentified scaly snail isolate Monju]BAN70037.1 conserved hypothetical protein [endosymbiont of unidentified scaly snail isolate Monju]
MNIRELASWCDDYLAVERFSDYCPNGLQVEAGEQVQVVVSGVTASLALIEAAIEREADVLLVHHGYFWKNEPAPLTGIKGRRVRALMRHGISLLAYHLPLDAHPEVGNNAGLGRALGFHGAPLEEGSLVWGATLDQPLEGATLADQVAAALGREPLRLGPERPIRRIAWCTGAAQGALIEAAEAGFDAFISGEVSEQTYHLAHELGVLYLAAGHHATETFGVRGLGEVLAERFGLRHYYVELDNPV